MKGRWIRWFLLSALAAWFAIGVDGCSLIMMGTGAAMDAGKPRWQQVRASDLVRVDVGMRVSVLLRDSTRVAGFYRGPVAVPDSEYATQYRAWRARDPRGQAFPELGEKVRLDPGSKGIFQGFSASGIRIGPPGHIYPSDLVPGGSIERRDGTRLAMDTVRELAFEGVLPIGTMIRIETPEGERRVRVEEVAWIEGPTYRHAARNGFIAGVMVDALIVAVIASQPEETVNPQCQDNGDWGHFLLMRTPAHAPPGRS